MRKFQCLLFVLNLHGFANIICMVAPLNTQHVSKTQTPHVLIICILKKRQCFFSSSTVETGISDHHSLICTMLRSTFCKDSPKFIYYRFDHAPLKKTIDIIIKSL